MDLVVVEYVKQIDCDMKIDDGVWQGYEDVKCPVCKWRVNGFERR